MHDWWFLSHTHTMIVVFESLVQSGLLAPSALDRNYNQSFYFQNPPKTGLDRCRLVFCSFLQLQDWF